MFPDISPSDWWMRLLWVLHYPWASAFQVNILTDRKHHLQNKSLVVKSWCGDAHHWRVVVPLTDWRNWDQTGSTGRESRDVNPTVLNFRDMNGVVSVTYLSLCRLPLSVISMFSSCRKHKQLWPLTFDPNTCPSPPLNQTASNKTNKSPHITWNSPTGFCYDYLNFWVIQNNKPQNIKCLHKYNKIKSHVTHMNSYLSLFKFQPYFYFFYFRFLQLFSARGWWTQFLLLERLFSL